MRGQSQPFLKAYKENLSKPDPECREDVQQTVPLLHEHLFEEELTVGWLKARCHINGKSFSARFKACLGCYPKDYITYHRIEASKVLLMQTEATVTDIGLAVGFSSISVFCNTFKSRTGVWPGQWRGNNGKAYNRSQNKGPFKGENKGQIKGSGRK